MKLDLETPGDALPLLAYKIAPRQFDLSYRFSNISLRDQIVRAQTLIRTLLQTGLVSPGRNGADTDFELLICGAGTAGLAAAKEADAYGIRFVLIEKDGVIPGGILNKSADRYVSTAMYEWPHPNHVQHSYPLATPVLLGNDDGSVSSLKLNFTKPVRIGEFGVRLGQKLRPDILKWTSAFNAFEKAAVRSIGPSMLIRCASIARLSKAALKALLNNNLNIHGLPLSDIRLPAVELDYTSSKSAADRTFSFSFVIFAGGFAQESSAYAFKLDAVTNKLVPQMPFARYVHDKFWDKDQVFDTSLGFAKPQPSVGILGSGDGALQDALRCLVGANYPHPLAIWDGLMAHRHGKRRALKHSPHVRRALVCAAAADVYTTGGAIWHHGTHVFQSLDATFRKIIDELYTKEKAKLESAIDALVRRDVGQITIVTRHGYFAKAYALNRFLILLFAKRFESECAGRIKLELLAGDVTNFTQIGKEIRGGRLSIRLGKSIVTRRCDLVIIRGGLDKSNPPSQQTGLTGIDTGRAELGRIPAPIRPVAI